jgi:hypothetical protein
MFRTLSILGLLSVTAWAPLARGEECHGDDCPDEAVPELPPFRTFRLELSPFGGVLVGDPDALSIVTGLTSRIYVHNRVAVGLEGSLFQRQALTAAAERADVRARRMGLGLHLSWVAASGEIGDGTVADFYLLGGGGIVTALQPPTDPTKGRLDFTEMVTIGAGSRFFFTSWLGVVAEARGTAILDAGLAAPTPAFEGRLGLTALLPPRRLDRVEL